MYYFAHWVKVALTSCLVVSGSMVMAQNATDARRYMDEKNYDKALPVYEELYKQSPDSFHTEYVNALLTAGKFKVAEKIAEKRASTAPKWPPDPSINMELGQVYERAGKTEKARIQFDSVLKVINGDDILTTNLAKAFTDIGHDDYAILTYETALNRLGNPPMYGRQLATLHARTGNLDKAVDALLRGGPSVFVTAESAKEMLLEIIGTDQKKLQQVQKAIIRKINQQPDNNYYAEILTWVYTQRNDWDGALLQIQAIDERNNESGRRVMEFARTAIAARQYDLALRAFDDVIARGPEQPFYITAQMEKLTTGYNRIIETVDRKPEEVAALAALYDTFLTKYPAFYAQRTASEFAALHAEYGNNPKRAISILNRSISIPETRRNMMGQFKLQLGDYYVLVGRMWDASLTYSQVDKEFKQDALGEDARFRNARLAYYMGDFDLAQKQLGILKSGTSNLISNDAIDLSVLITENVEDSNTAPLHRFAYAGLLLFQNRDTEAEKLVDSIAQAWPKHPLADDLVMMRARIAIKHRDYPQALTHLKKVIDTWGKDVLGDDALFTTAEIYHNNLHQAQEAKKYYEQLIIDYPGSTYVQTARQKLAALKEQGVQ
jgi:tetratricopeptide (TPR) repeat protein